MEKVGMTLAEFYKNKTVYITGHTGFKGSWLSKVLIGFGAKVVGYSLKPNTIPNLFDLLQLERDMVSIIGDVRDYDKLKTEIEKYNPDIIFHLAAQPLVRESYDDPKYTYETNIMGTVNLLEIIRHSEYCKSFINVTTDKVYKNNEWHWGYRENEPLDGYDPYSNSKSCSDLITQSYMRSFFSNKDIGISIMRAGNVIGGGDFSKDRIIPDCIRAALNKDLIRIRNPHSIRPYQHVLEPIFAYLFVAYQQYFNKNLASIYNVGPNDEDCIKTGDLVDLFCLRYGNGLTWKNESTDGPHEANFLKLDCSKIKHTFSWKPLMNIDRAIQLTADWINVYQFKNTDIGIITSKQIEEYNALFHKEILKSI